MTSRLAALRKGRRHPQLRATIERSWSRDRLRRRATAGEVMRGLVVRGRARGSYRLQKSTGGARPFTPEDEESSDHDDGSSPSARERRRGERASEAGSSVAKPRDRWRVPTKPVGSRERIDLGAPVEGRRFGSGKSSSLTRGRRKRSWLLESVRVSGLLRGATGSVRGRTSASCMAEKARPRWYRRKAAPGSALAERRTETCTDRPKLEARRQARAQPGPDYRKVVRRRTGELGPRVGEASCGQRSASCAPGSRAVHGCSCRESIAEVGEKHLLRAVEGSREANRGWHGVARSGGGP